MVEEFFATQTVIPAKAVVRQAHHPEQSRRGIQKIEFRENWMPAYAGMTIKTPDPTIKKINSYLGGRYYVWNWFA